MIIDSHAHYNNSAYEKSFRYLSYDKDGYALKEGELPQLISGIMSRSILLTVAALLFAPAHILISYQNTKGEKQ